MKRSYSGNRAGNMRAAVCNRGNVPGALARMLSTNVIHSQNCQDANGKRDKADRPESR